MERRRIGRSGLTRLPLVSLGLAAFLLLAFPVVQLGFASRLEDVHERLGAAVDFAIRNPMVEIDRRMLPVIRGVLPGFESNELFAFLKRGAGKREGGRKQKEFDGLLFEAFSALDAHPYRRLGVVPSDRSLPSLFTYPFIHAGWIHLFATVLLLLLAGPLLERAWGKRIFAGVLLCTALIGASAFSLAHMGADHALVGASAVVSGLVAAVVVLYWKKEVNLLGWLSPLVDLELRASSWVLGAGWIAYEASLWWVSRGVLPTGVDNAVGYAAHAAGAVVGGLLPLAIARFGLDERLGGDGKAVAEGPWRAETRFDLQQVLLARAKGDVEGAFAMLDAEIQRSARNRDAVTTFWEMAVGRGETERAVPAMLQLIREELRRGCGEIAVSHWRELAEQAPDARLEPVALLRLLPYIREQDGDENAVLALQQAMSSGTSGPSCAVACEIARLASDLDGELALAAATRALRDAELGEERRAELEAICARFRRGEEEEPSEKPDLPANVFYDEQDRSGFGEVGDLAEFGAPGSAFPSQLVTDAVPVAFEADGLVVELPEEGRVRIGFASVGVVALGGVRGLGPRPVVVVDLFVAGAAPGEPVLQILRLRGDQYDPRRLVPGVEAPLDALRAMMEELLERTQARPLPDPSSARAKPVRIFESLEVYQAELSTKLDF